MMVSLRNCRLAIVSAVAVLAISAIAVLNPSGATRPGSSQHQDRAADAGATHATAPVEPASPRRKAAPRQHTVNVAPLDLQDARVVANHFEELKAAALDGDSTAGQALHLALDNCRGAPREAPPSKGPMNSRTAIARYKFENCRYFEARQLAFDASLVHDMAERGENAGRVAYYQAGSIDLDPAAADYRERFSSYAADALRYLREAASEGDGDALWSLSDAYSEGRIVAADSARASAYRLSWQYVQANPDGKSLDMDRLLNLAESQLGPGGDAGEEARIAQMAAEDILKFRGNR